MPRFQVDGSHRRNTDNPGSWDSIYGREQTCGKSELVVPQKRCEHHTGFGGLREVFTTAGSFSLTMCSFSQQLKFSRTTCSFSQHVKVFAGCEMHDDASLAKLEVFGYTSCECVSAVFILELCA